MDYAPMVTLEGVDGSQWALSAKGPAGNLWLQRGAQGLAMPAYDVQVDEFPNRPGAYPRAVRASGREIFLPVTIWGKTRPEMIATRRRFIRALPPNRHARRMAKLVVAEVDETGAYEDQREIEVYYDTGMEGDEGSDNGLTWGKYGLILQATDPYFRARQDVRVPFTSYEETRPFYPPEGESFVSKDGVSGGFKLTKAPVYTDSIVVHNPGEEPAYPTFEFVGPITNEPFNLVRDETFDSYPGSLAIRSMELGDGEAATLVTEPGRVSLSTSAGVQAVWSQLAPNPRFWALDPGDNTVRIVGLSSVPGSVVVSFRPRFLGM